jgi:hypothetical protein
MLKDKEVVSDPQQQYEIAKQVHLEQHAGINKTTAAIAVKYHWVRIKETVSRVIRDCPDCKETVKVPSPSSAADISVDDTMNMEEDADGKQAVDEQPDTHIDPHIPQVEPMPAPQMIHHTTIQQHQNPFTASHSSILQGHVGSLSDYTSVPLDPQIMNLHQIPRFQTHDTITDPYGHTHPLHDSNVRHHVAPNEYHMMVDDPSDTDANTLGLVHSQANDVHHEQMMKYQYVAHGEDELDFT